MNHNFLLQGSSFNNRNNVQFKDEFSSFQFQLSETRQAPPDPNYYYPDPPDPPDPPPEPPQCIPVQITNLPATIYRCPGDDLNFTLQTSGTAPIRTSTNAPSTIPNIPGTQEYTYIAVNGCGEAESNLFVVVDSVRFINLPATRNAAINELFTFTLEYEGNPTLIAPADALPSWLTGSFDNQGRLASISGTPTQSGRWVIPIHMQGLCNNVTENLTIVVCEAITVDVPDCPLTLCQGEGYTPNLLTGSNPMFTITRLGNKPLPSYISFNRFTGRISVSSAPLVPDYLSIQFVASNFCSSVTFTIDFFISQGGTSLGVSTPAIGADMTEHRFISNNTRQQVIDEINLNQGSYFRVIDE